MAKKTKVTKVNWNKNKAGQARYKDEAYKMFYTRVMRGEKRLKGVVKDVSVDEFLKGVKGNYDVTALKRVIESGYPISLPVLDLKQGKKVGIETAVACRELGVDKMPVLVCGKPKKATKKD